MSRPFIMQCRPYFGAEEKSALLEYMDEDGFITEFKRTEKFERLIADFTGAKHCIVVNNGTVSLTLAAIASGICPDDEVIVPNYTMIATPNSIKMIGATPVFVDVEPDTLCMDIAKVKEAITSRTKAIIFVSPNGRFPRVGIEEFEVLANEHHLALIEDAAQSLGSFYPDGRHIGRAGSIGSFSFSAPKIISTGQGGALITDDDELDASLRRLKDFGRASGGNDIHDTVGFNFKFTELQACVGIAQFSKLPARVSRKREIWTRYASNLRGVSELALYNHDVRYTTPWFIDCIVQDRSELASFLFENGIGTRVMYPPINKQKAYSLGGDYVVSEHVGRSGLWLPSSVQLTNTEIDMICECIRSFYQ